MFTLFHYVDSRVDKYAKENKTTVRQWVNRLNNCHSEGYFRSVEVEGGREAAKKFTQYVSGLTISENDWQEFKPMGLSQSLAKLKFWY